MGGALSAAATGAVEVRPIDAPAHETIVAP